METTTPQAGVTAEEMARLHELLEGSPPQDYTVAYWRSLNDGQREAIAERYRSLLDSRGITAVVYVVAWVYATGGGFDWYFKQAAADERYRVELRESAEGVDDGWTPFYFGMRLPAHYDGDKITDCVSRVFDTCTYIAEGRATT